MDGLKLMTTLMAGALLAACGGGGGSDPAPTPPSGDTPDPAPTPPPASQGPAKSDLETKSEVAVFLQMAGLDAVGSEVDALTGDNAARWVEAELAKPAFGYEALMRARLTQNAVNRTHSSKVLWESLLTSDAELRARMTFALSQLIVVGNTAFGMNVNYGLGTWLDVLDRHAFGNYRDLLQDVTYSPIMAEYLTYAYNRKGDPDSGRQPDENYAREILQLFSIGLVELNMDGTPKLSGGAEIETYDNEDVVGLARVFTGLAHQGTDFRRNRRNADSYHVPMEMVEREHSELEKSFLGSTIPAGTPGDASIDQALDIIFAHPNVAPFVSRQLIQRFTGSHPAPAYVERVATAFENGSFTSEDGTTFGTGARGDLSATLAAILLDETIHDDVSGATEGKVREPVLKFAQLARTFAKPGTMDVTVERYNDFSDTSDKTRALAQSPLKSPSVFNFYRPGYIAPSTETGDAGLTAPELQIVNQASALGYLNFATRFITRGENSRTDIPQPDFGEEIALADNAAELVDLLDLKLTGATMNAQTRDAIIEAVDALPVRENNADRDRQSRVRIAVLMTVASADYAVLD